MDTISIEEKKKLQLLADVDFILRELYVLRRPASLPPKEKGYHAFNRQLSKKIQTRNKLLTDGQADIRTSQILKTLLDKGLVSNKVETTNVYYWINDKGEQFLLANESCFEEYHKEIQQRLNAKAKEIKAKENESRFDSISKKINLFVGIGALIIGGVSAYFGYISIQQNKDIEDLKQKIESIERALPKQQTDNTSNQIKTNAR